jgi:hypothetical protein
MEIFITTAVRTSNLTRCKLLKKKLSLSKTTFARKGESVDLSSKLGRQTEKYLTAKHTRPPNVCFFAFWTYPIYRF